MEAACAPGTDIAPRASRQAPGQTTGGFNLHRSALARGCSDTHPWQSLSDALAEMERQAVQLGADAVVGVDIDYETVGNNMLMVSASGTAVKLG